MTITVTQRDINQGMMRDSTNCMLALAVKRALDTSLVAVTHEHIIVGKEIFYMDEDTKARVQMFDRGRQVDPFSFELNLVEPNEANDSAEITEQVCSL